MKHMMKQLGSGGYASILKTRGTPSSPLLLLPKNSTISGLINNNATRSFYSQTKRNGGLVISNNWKQARHSFSTAASTLDLIDKLKVEIAEEIEMDTKQMSEELKIALENSIFEVKEDKTKTGVVIFSGTQKGVNIKATFDAAKLKYVEVQGEDENSKSGLFELSVEIEISAASSSNQGTKLVITGTISRNEDEQNESEPYMTPNKIMIAKTSAVSGKIDEYSPEIEEVAEPLQDSISEWIADHGIDDQFFSLMIDFAMFKENQMYTNWLLQFESFLQNTKKQT